VTRCGSIRFTPTRWTIPCVQDALRTATPPGTRMTPETPKAPNNLTTLGVHDSRHDARSRADIGHAVECALLLGIW